MKKLLFIFTFLLVFISLKAQQDTIIDDLEFNTEIKEDNSTGKGGAGSFGKRLSNLTSFVSLNGYVTNEFLYYENGVNTFNNHYFNLLASAEVSKKIFAEIQMTYEYGGSALTARYAQIDYKISDLFIIRSGKFLIPAGEFNEYMYPEFLSKTTTRAFVNTEIIPVSWGEVGVQLRGETQLGGDAGIFHPFYSLYLVNGLRGTDGGAIRGMRGNYLDVGPGKLAYGGNVGVEIGEFFNMEGNYYTGDYNPKGNSQLEISGTSFGFDNHKLSVYGAYHTAKQEYKDSTTVKGEVELHKFGFYGLVAYRYKNFEPVIRYDQIRLDGAPTEDRDRVTFGINYHFYQNCVVKVNYDMTTNKGVDIKDNLFSVQLSVGF